MPAYPLRVPTTKKMSLIIHLKENSNNIYDLSNIHDLLVHTIFIWKDLKPLGGIYPKLASSNNTLGYPRFGSICSQVWLQLINLRLEALTSGRQVSSPTAGPYSGQ